MGLDFQNHRSILFVMTGDFERVERKRCAFLSWCCDN